MCDLVTFVSHFYPYVWDIPHIPTLSHLAGGAQGRVVCVRPFVRLLRDRSLRVHTFHTARGLWHVRGTRWLSGGWQEVADKAGCTLGRKGGLGLDWASICHRPHHAVHWGLGASGTHTGRSGAGRRLLTRLAGGCWHGWVQFGARSRFRTRAHSSPPITPHRPPVWKTSGAQYGGWGGLAGGC